MLPRTKRILAFIFATVAFMICGAGVTLYVNPMLGITAVEHNYDDKDPSSRPPDRTQKSRELMMKSMRDKLLTQFNLDNPLIDFEDLLAGGPPKDGIPALTDPERVAVADAEFPNKNDRVIEVVIGDTAVAYPINILNWHEIINDTVADVPIAVTYCPLCDSVAVLDRRLESTEPDKEPTVLEFGVSGLLYNSNVMMFERGSDALWSQVYMKAVTGPDSGRSLTHLPVRMMSFEAFQTAHADGEVLTKNTGHRRNYESNPYQRYFDTPDSVFHPFEYGAALPPKTLGMGVTVGEFVIFVPWDHAIKVDTVQIGTPAGEIVIDANESGMVFVTGPEEAHAIQTFFHSWSAFYPKTTIIGGEDVPQPEKTEKTDDSQ